jgi:endoglucanase
LSRRPFIASLLTIALSAAGCSSAHGGGAASHGDAVHDPLRGRVFYVDPRSAAALQAAQWRLSGRGQDAAAIAKLARQPTGTWINSDGDLARVRSVVAAATPAHRTALFVAYDIPDRDCGQFSSGGAASATAYQAWVTAFAQSIGASSATVIVEPDAVAQTISGCQSAPPRASRYALLRFAVHTFAALPNTAVYLDAGNAGWVKRVSRLVGPLRASGIRQADGFVLNVSNFYSTAATVRYGTALSKVLGGKHFVIDTGRNGNGPYKGSDGAPNWCNPPGRAIGHAPTVHTGNPLVDAFLWIKVPGESDGSCRPGAPAAGQWWPDYALSLVRNAH